MNTERLNSMLDRYGEVCTQQVAGKILSVDPRTIYRMLEEGRLRRVGHRVDVRSLAEYIENPQGIKLLAQTARTTKKPQSAMQISRDDFLAAARKGHWSKEVK